MSSWAAVSEFQLVLAGFALLLAAQQAIVWRWEGAGSSARLMALTAAATAAVFITGHAAVVALREPDDLDLLLFLRSGALAGLALSTLPLAGTVTTRRTPRWLVAALVLVCGCRLALWPVSNLIYRHQTVGGFPSYGPLMALSGFAVIALVFGYLCACAAGPGPSDRERPVLVGGLIFSMCLAVITLVAGNPIAAEVLSGYVPFPALLAMAGMLWTRQLRAFRTVRELGDNQRVLAELGTLALTAELAVVVAAADAAVADHTAARTTSGRADGEFLVAVGAVLSAAESRRDASALLRRRATTDELTGLANRSRLVEVITDALADPGSTVDVGLCAIDRFRAVNDMHGHPTGDDVLRQVALRLREGAQGCDLVGRLGGDEFVVVCTNGLGGHDISPFGQRLADAFARPFVIRNVEARITASIGIVTAATSDDRDADADTMLRDADTAMWDAKSRGGADIGQFRDELRSAVVFRSDLERRLTGAVDRGEILVHYQPILTAADRRIVGFEALARWRQGDVLVGPEEWIPIAESTGLIEDIGECVLRQATEQLRQWLGEGHDISVSVNVSPRQLSSRRFPDLVKGCLDGGIPARRLTLEVTESLAVDEHASRVLAELRHCGVRIALDDFGTGYSALAALSRLPLDVLKIDRSIVRHVAEPDGQALASAIFAIAGTQGLLIVAEGVETSEQESALARLGALHVQGYLYSRPVNAETARQLLHARYLSLDNTMETS
ncbi:MAG: hypothetical protein JWO12_540 [Frankiales bacterium]|nr:hypothetical protein [Frankiales bacterium]